MKKKSLFVSVILVLSTAFIFACAPKKANETQKQAQAQGQAQEPSVKVEVVTKPEVKEEPPERLLIADFNSGSKPNNLGGDFGAWGKDPSDSTQYCGDSFNADERYGREGYALGLTYDVDSPNPAYNGFWMKLNNINAAPYNKIVFYLKGDPDAGYPAKIKIELKNAKGNVGKTYITQISGTWAPVEVPFGSFQGIKDFSNMAEFTMVFEDHASKPKTGKIYIDNIEFVRD